MLRAYIEVDGTMVVEAETLISEDEGKYEIS